MPKEKKTTVLSPQIETPHCMSEEAWDNAQESMLRNSELLSHRIYSLSAGGLALSFTVISFIVGQKQLTIEWPALVIWGGFLICIIIDTYSIVLAKNKASQLETIAGSLIKTGQKLSDDDANRIIDKLNKPLILLEVFVLVLLFATIIGAAVYCYCLLI